MKKQAIAVVASTLLLVSGVTFGQEEFVVDPGLAPVIGDTGPVAGRIAPAVDAPPSLIGDDVPAYDDVETSQPQGGMGAGGWALVTASVIGAGVALAGGGNSSDNATGTNTTGTQ